jgi:hypothetical protein
MHLRLPHLDTTWNAKYTRQSAEGAKHDAPQLKYATIAVWSYM